MYALKFKFKKHPNSLSLEAFGALLYDFITAAHTASSVLRTQVYYPDNSDLGDMPPDEFMIEVVDESALESLWQFLQNRTDVDQACLLPWDPAEAMSPQQSGMWCHSYHAGHLRLNPSQPYDPSFSR